VTEAYLAFAKAAALEPDNKTYWQRSRRPAHARPVRGGKAAVASGPGHLPEEALTVPAATFEDRMEARPTAAPTELKAAPGLHDFDLRGDSRSSFEEVAKAYGLVCVFDKEYQPVPSFRFAVTAMDYREALYALQSATASFAVPLDARTILVAKDTRPSAPNSNPPRPLPSGCPA